MSKHTPTPWESSELSAYTVQGPKGQYVCQVIGRDPVERLENERFIVRAVNAHDELLHALRLAKALLEGQTEETEENVIELLNEVLAKVEGK